MLQKLQNKTIQMILLGSLLALLSLLIHFAEYKYFVHELNPEYYTAIIATLFTALGLWLGFHFVTKKNEQVEPATEKHSTSNHIPSNLNEREYEVLHLISQGYSNQEIANQLFIALPTVKTHASNLYVKLDVKNRTQAVHKARELNMI